MPRLPRHLHWVEEACFHLMDRGYNRDPVFIDDDDRRAFLGLVDRYRRRFGFRLYHYCLMTNHFHLLLQLDDPRQVSPLMAGLLRAYVYHCHRRHGFVGHRWQGRFKSPAVQRRDYLLSCGRSIERNPLAAGLVVEPWQYGWSSARAYAYAYALGTVDALLAENPEYLDLSETPARRQQRWREFLLGTDAREEVVCRGDWALGDAEFRRRVLLEHGRPVPRRRGRPPRATGTNPRIYR